MAAAVETLPVWSTSATTAACLQNVLSQVGDGGWFKSGPSESSILSALRGVTLFVEKLEEDLAEVVPTRSIVYAAQRIAEHPRLAEDLRVEAIAPLEAVVASQHQQLNELRQEVVACLVKLVQPASAAGSGSGGSVEIPRRALRALVMHLPLETLLSTFFPSASHVPSSDAPFFDLVAEQWGEKGSVELKHRAVQTFTARLGGCSYASRLKAQLLRRLWKGTFDATNASLSLALISLVSSQLEELGEDGWEDSQQESGTEGKEGRRTQSVGALLLEAVADEGVAQEIRCFALEAVSKFSWRKATFHTLLDCSALAAASASGPAPVGAVPFCAIKALCSLSARRKSIVDAADDAEMLRKQLSDSDWNSLFFFFIHCEAKAPPPLRGMVHAALHLALAQEPVGPALSCCTAVLAHDRSASAKCVALHHVMECRDKLDHNTVCELYMRAWDDEDDGVRQQAVQLLNGELLQHDKIWHRAVAFLLHGESDSPSVASLLQLMARHPPPHPETASLLVAEGGQPTTVLVLRQRNLVSGDSILADHAMLKHRLEEWHTPLFVPVEVRPPGSRFCFVLRYKHGDEAYKSCNRYILSSTSMLWSPASFFWPEQPRLHFHLVGETRDDCTWLRRLQMRFCSEFGVPVGRVTSAWRGDKLQFTASETHADASLPTDPAFNPSVISLVLVSPLSNAPIPSQYFSVPQHREIVDYALGHRRGLSRSSALSRRLMGS